MNNSIERKKWIPHTYEPILLTVFTIIILSLPFIVDNDYALNFVILTLFWAYMGFCWNIIGGFAGQLSMGHVMYFGTGAYVSLYLQVTYNWTPWICMLFGAFASVILGKLVAILSLRYGLKGDYYALFTIACSQLLRVAVANIPQVGGAAGLMVPILDYSLINFQFEKKSSYLIIICFFIYIVAIASYYLLRSKMGRYFLAIRENEMASEAIGVDTYKYKTNATLISAFFTGLGATFYVQYVGYLTPTNAFDMMTVSIQFILLTVIGGRGYLLGPLLGAFILRPFSEYFRTAFGGGTAGVHLLIYGVVLVAVILIIPKGLTPVLENLTRSIVQKTKKLRADGEHVAK